MPSTPRSRRPILASRSLRVPATTTSRSPFDSGPGIPLDVRQHLFDSFFTTKPDGLGLGLAIVRSIVERHQGRVHADNAEGGGATFRVVMPRNDRMRSVAEARRPAVTRSASSVSSVSSVSSDLVRLAFRE